MILKSVFSEKTGTMRIFLFLLLLVSFCNTSFAQIVYPYGDIKLEKPSDYKATELLALSAANTLLTTPFNEIDAGRDSAMSFLTKWVAGAKDYQFYLKGYIEDLLADKNVLGLYVAAMTKYTLENKKDAANPIKTEQEASRIILAYCNDPKNNFRLKKKMRKLLEDHVPVTN